MIKISISDDAAYLRLSDATIVESEEVDTDVIYDFDCDDQVVGIEILRLKDKKADQFKKLDLPVTAEDKAKLKQFFSLVDTL
jgi:uncharacterized protein YuzE